MKFGYDYSYISKQFKQKIGISFNKYVNLLRIQKCQKLIRETQMTFSEIMVKCGFSSLRSFDRSFKILTGQSPTEYKKLVRESADSVTATYLPPSFDDKED